MSDFDLVKANREILTGMIETRNVLAKLEREWEQKMSEAETNLNHVRKIIGFTDEYIIAPQREKVRVLMEAQTTKEPE